MKNKTLALWLALLLGPFGIHRLYLQGRFDGFSAALFTATCTGIYGIVRAQDYGLDDVLSWWLIPWVGLTIAACSLTAIVYGLMDTEKWNSRYNPTAGNLDPATGQTNWLTVMGLATALFIGATTLMATIAFTFEHYFDYQTHHSTSAHRSRKA